MDPPKLKDYPYDKWVTLVQIWAEDTSLPADKLGNRVILRSLEGDVQDAAIEVGQDVIKSDTGLAMIIEKLDGLYRVDDETKQYLLFEELYNLKRPSDMAVLEYTSRFDRLVSKLVDAKVDLPQPVLAFTYLKNANLSEEKASLIRSTASAKTLAAFKTALVKGCEKPSQADFSSNVVVKEEALYQSSSGGGYSRGNRFNSGRRGRRGQYSGRSRGSNGRSSTSGDVSEYRETKDLKDIQCFRCKKYGHYANKCNVPWSELTRDVYQTDDFEGKDEKNHPKRRKDDPEECHVSFSEIPDERL